MSINLSEIQEKIQDTIKNLTSNTEKEKEIVQIQENDKKIELQLGDIIRIEDPSDDNLNNNILLSIILINLK